MRLTSDHHQNLISCPRVEIQGLITTNVPRKSQRGNLAYETYSFCPLVSSDVHKERATAVQEMVDLVLENHNDKKIEILDAFLKKDQSTVGIVSQIIAMKPLLQVTHSSRFWL